MYIAIFLLKHLQLNYILIATFPIYYINTIVSVSPLKYVNK